MILLTAPQTLPDLSPLSPRRLFLAGGITGASNWQSEMIDRLETSNLLLLNPRREDYPHHDPAAEREQVRWEHHHLQGAHAVSFWFVSETLCPITLFELGSCVARGQTIFVGMDHDYARRNNVLVQLELARPDVEPVFSLENLAEQVRAWANHSNLGEQ